METISNLASGATSVASKLIYGDPTKTEEAVDQTKNNETGGKEPVSGEQGKGTAVEPFDQGNAPTPLVTADKGTWLDYSNNETAGKEPVSGEQGKGTVTEPFDQGNDAKATDKSASADEFLKLDPATKPKSESTGDPKIYTDGKDATYIGMPIVPLNPDVATSNPGAASSATESTGITDKTGVTEKVWKDTPLDDISRSGAPGAGPTGPSDVTTAAPASAATTTTTSTDPSIKTSAPDAATASSKTYGGSATHSDEGKYTDQLEKRDTPGWTSTGVAAKADHLGDAKQANIDDSKGLAGERAGRKSESADLTSSPSNDEKSGKMSHLKEKMKNKLHIGSKDK